MVGPVAGFLRAQVAYGDLQSLGQALRQAREARAMTLDEVEVQTRIRIKYLAALESGDLSVLPSVTHAKGFLRNYAQFLHLDANALVADLAALTGSATPPVTTLTAPPPRPAPSISRDTGSASVPSPFAEAAEPSSPTILPSSGPPVGGLGRTTYITADTRVGPAMPRGVARHAPYPLAVQPLPPEPEPPRIRSRLGRLMRSNLTIGIILLIGFAGIVWWASTQLSQVSVEDIVPTPAQPLFLEEFAGGMTVEPSLTFQPTSTPTPNLGVQFLDRVVLSMNVIQHTWMRVTVDGEIVFEGLVDPGVLLQYQGQETIGVLAGNAAALEINYNGQDIGSLGERGQVVERFFTVSGQITPTPTPTLTTTPTSVPTPTPRLSATPGE